MRPIWHIKLLMFAASALLAQSAHAKIEPLPVIDRELRANFPEVSTIDATDLQTLVNSGHRPIILDVREADEFAVSHLPGSARVDPGAELDDVLRATGSNLKGRTVIVYCSVGVRSTELAARVRQGLKTRGAARIANLREGIFGWHNRSLPLVRGQQATPYIHPYNGLWGQLVRRQALISYTPSPPNLPQMGISAMAQLAIYVGLFLVLIGAIFLARMYRRRQM